MYTECTSVLFCFWCQLHQWVWKSMKYRIYHKYQLRDLQRKVFQTFAESNACLGWTDHLSVGRLLCRPNHRPYHALGWALSRGATLSRLFSQDTLYLVQSSEMQCECLRLSFSTLVSVALHHLISSISHQRCHWFPYIKWYHLICCPEITPRLPWLWKHLDLFLQTVNVILVL